MCLVQTVPQKMRVGFILDDFVCRCYCILHDENVLGAIFSIWDELKTAKTWEEVEQVVWGELNNYKGFPLDPKI